MEEAGQFATVKCVRFERVLPGPIERVWQHLTETALLPGWFGNGVIEHRAGGKVSLKDGQIRGIVTQWSPPQRLAYTWNVFLPGEGTSRYPESYLMIDLQPRGHDVLLTLTHLPVLDRFEKQNALGWHTFLDIVHAAASGSPPEPLEVYMRRNAQRYGVDLANLVR
jgi:uncharacterized protein YndB with AHSA1/START domain